MNIKIQTVSFVIAFTITTASSSQVAAQNPNDILIVANNNVKENSISEEELAALFLKQRVTWKDGSRVWPVHSADQKLKAEFLRRIVGMTIDEEKRYWQEQKIKYAKSPTPEFGDVLKAVFHLHGAVGYIYRSDFKQNVSKILLVLPQK